MLVVTLHNSGISPTKLAAKLVTKNGKPTKALERLVARSRLFSQKRLLQVAQR